MTSLTTITVSYGSDDWVVSMLSSLRRTMRDGNSDIDWSAIVVCQPDDNGGTAANSVRAGASWAQVVELDENLGFAGANNFAVAETSSEFIAFLNPDLELTEGWLAPLLAALDDPQVAIAAPVLLNGEGDIDEAGQVVFSDGGSLAIGGPHWPDWPRSYRSVMLDRDVDYASAACWVMRRLTFDELGGFSTDYWPAYFEDADLGFRARQAGYRTRLVTARPVVHHHEGASADRVELARRSRAVFEATWANELTRQPDRSLLTSDVEQLIHWHHR